MAINPKNSQTPGEEGFLENLAEDLFGIDFAKKTSADDDIRLEELPSEETPEPEPPIAEEEASPVEVGFGGLLSEFSDSPADPEDESDIEVEDIEVEVESAETASDDDDQNEESDTYWDALSEWNWDEGSRDRKSTASASEHRKPSKARPVSRTRAESSRVPPPKVEPVIEDSESTEDLHEEFNDDDGFGMGILDEESVTSDSKPSDLAGPEATAGTVSEAEGTSDEVAETDATPRKRRRRRRRRGGKRSESKATPPEEAETPTVEGQASVEEEVAEESVADVSEEAEESSGEEEKRGRRSSHRRPRRRRKKSETVEQEEAASEVSEDVPVIDEELDAEDDFGSDLDEDESAEETSATEKPASRRAVPTWEEAISYLLKPTGGASTSSGNSTGGRRTRSRTGRGRGGRSSGSRGRQGSSDS